MGKLYSIKEIEQICGIKAHTIRMWEQRYNIVQPLRAENNKRYYNEEHLRKLLNVVFLNRNGHKISKIANMSAMVLRNAIINISETVQDNSDLIQKLSLAAINFDEDVFEKIISQQIISIGFENMMIRLMLPFLEKLQILWQANVIQTSQRVFIINLIRKKLYLAIESLVVVKLKTPKSFALFINGAEIDDIHLLFSYYLIKSKGHKCIYLGQLPKVEDIQLVYQNQRPDYIFASVSTINPSCGIEDLVKVLQTSAPENLKMIFNSGYGVPIQKTEDIIIFNHVDNFINFLNRA